MELEPIEKQTFKCPQCYEHYEDYHRACRCIFKHAKERLANAMLETGDSLSQINFVCGFGWELSDVQRNITKESCFVISYLQCCDKPAYRISSINSDGGITVYGRGSWSGGYSSKVRLDSLNDPRPASEHFIDKRSV